MEILPGFYDYLEERPLGGGNGRRRRTVDARTHPRVSLGDLTHHYSSDYPWWHARVLEARGAADEREGVWPINHWRAERYFGDPGVAVCPYPTRPTEWPADIHEIARRFPLHHYYRLLNASECQAAVVRNEEVRLSVEVTGDWHDPRGGAVPLPAADAPVLGAHAVPLTGWDAAAKRFEFPNSWGPGWGDRGRGSLSPELIDRLGIEAWRRVGVGWFPPVSARTGLVRLLWKSSFGGEVHGREVLNAGTGERVAWAFCVRRGPHLDIDELFVWPSHRRRGLGRHLVELVAELSRGMRSPLRAWVSWADYEPANRPGLQKVLGLLGLHLHPSPTRLAAFVALPIPYPGVLVEPRRPDRPASMLQDLDPASGPRLYTVWFGTNRRPHDAKDPSNGFSGDRSDQTYFGKCQVAIPHRREIGTVNASWWRRYVRRCGDTSLRVVGRTVLPEDEFWKGVAEALGEPGDQREALVFLHGYRNTFDQAVIRAAQLGFDLKVPGITAVFSWPSRGRVFSYPADEASIQASEGSITEFLVNLVRRSGAEKVHLIAHSMGNRGLLGAIQRITSRVERETRVRFGQIILAAPDVDRDVFVELAKGYRELADRTTLYVSPSDRAVGCSRWLHEYPRVGLTPPVTVVDGIDTVEVAKLDFFHWTWHTYFAEARALLTDMFDLIRRNPNPDDRLGLSPKTTDLGVRYWQMES